MTQLIRQCVDLFGPAPREFSFWDRMTYLRVPPPGWLAKHPRDKIHLIFQNLHSLFAEGFVAWGHIIQANSQLFQPGKHDCPGELVFSLTQRERVSPDYLGRVARALFALKGTKPADPAKAGVADYLTNEKVRVFGMPVPTSISPSVSCQISTTFFARKHLPSGRLSLPLLPIIVHPRPPCVVMPLPSRFWPEALVEAWSTAS